MAARIRSLKPLFDRVLVQKAQPHKQSLGGIILPDTVQQKVNWGTVVEVGNGRRKDDGSFATMSVKKGDLVMLAGWEQTVKINEQEYNMVREEDILGIVELESNK